MAIQIFHKTEAGNGLEFVGGKYQVKAGRNVSVDGNGVNVDFPAPAVTVQSVTPATGGFTVTQTDGTSSKIDFPAQTVDVKLAGLEFITNTGQLKATLSDGTLVTTVFTTDIVLMTIQQMTARQKAQLVSALRDDLLTAIRGEEVQDSLGTHKGYLVR